MATHILPAHEPSWMSVFQANRRWLSTVVYARLRDRHAVEEVLQETALAASKNNGLVCDPEGTCRWLYSVAIRQALLYRRQRSRQLRKMESAVAAGVHRKSGEINDPFQLVLASEQRDLVAKAMACLNSRDYEILMLKYTEGWSCREMAERLGVSESAMKSRLLRARKNLRKRLLELNQDWELS